MNLKDKHIVIVGGATGIGFAVAQAAAAEGARVSLASTVLVSAIEASSSCFVGCEIFSSNWERPCADASSGECFSRTASSKSV